jgi:hypothetical protein
MSVNAQASAWAGKHERERASMRCWPVARGERSARAYEFGCVTLDAI